MEQTLVILKGDAVQRRLVGRLVARFEDKGLRIAAMKLLEVTPAMAKRLYSVHKGKDFYAPLVEFITASPVVAMVLQGVGAIDVCRKLMGTTFGPDAAPGTLRGDFGMSRRYNLVHGSDSPESAAREIPILFRKDEILRYELADETWVYARKGSTLI
jgi:nucleoside-diphosphate kinase